MTPQLLTRLKATSIHLAFSIIAFLAILYVIVVHWYPPPLFASDGGWQGVRIMMIVHLVLGPLLILIIFNPAKAGHLIVIDLVIICAIQLSAFAFGAWAIHSTRSVVLSVWDGRVYPVLASELALQDIDPREVSNLSEQRPPIVYVRRPQTPAEAMRVIDYSFQLQLAEPSISFLYAPLSDHIDDLFAYSIERRPQVRAEWLEKREQYLAQYDQPPTLAFLPFRGRYGHALLVFDEYGRLTDAVKP
jgi:hypothetical protein